MYFDYVSCSKWKNECNHCQNKLSYPSSVGLDMSKQNFEKKKKLFTGLNNMTLVTPSKWLANLVSESYMNEYEIKVIHNGIDTNVFKYTKNNIKKKYNCDEKKVVLGVASVWDMRKGLNSFIELSKRLDDTYQIILVGLNNKQIKKLPKKIIGINRTDSVQELAELYSSAEVFVNPTLEDNYPTTNIEAISCGTPVITYETGGSPESARIFGISVPKNSIDGILNAIYNIQNLCTKPTTTDINYQDTVQKYLKLYGEI